MTARFDDTAAILELLHARLDALEAGMLDTFKDKVKGAGKALVKAVKGDDMRFDAICRHLKEKFPGITIQSQKGQRNSTWTIAYQGKTFTLLYNDSNEWRMKSDQYNTEIKKYAQMDLFISTGSPLKK